MSRVVDKLWVQRYSAAENNDFALAVDIVT
jgi:hypothetical protein